MKVPRWPLGWSEGWSKTSGTGDLKFKCMTDYALMWKDLFVPTDGNNLKPQVK